MFYSQCNKIAVALLQLLRALHQRHTFTSIHELRSIARRAQDHTSPRPVLAPKKASGSVNPHVWFCLQHERTRGVEEYVPTCFIWRSTHQPGSGGPSASRRLKLSLLMDCTVFLMKHFRFAGSWLLSFWDFGAFPERTLWTTGKELPIIILRVRRNRKHQKTRPLFAWETSLIGLYSLLRTCPPLP